MPESYFNDANLGLEMEASFEEKAMEDIDVTNFIENYIVNRSRKGKVKVDKPADSATTRGSKKGIFHFLVFFVNGGLCWR